MKTAATGSDDGGFENCACKGANLGKFVQPIILKIISAESCNGYRLIKKMESFSTFLDSRPDPTGVYRYIKVMEEKGLIAKCADDDVYTITEHGGECLSNWKQTLRDYKKQISGLIKELE